MTGALIGRHGELDAIDEWYTQSALRVLTLKGPGGVGKTTLAQASHAAFGWPIALLEPCHTQNDLVSAIAEALHLSDVAGLDDALRQAQVVILDNAEQVVEPLREVLKGLTDECRFLVTSREPLGLKGEQVLDVLPLTREDAVTLFIRRAELSSSLTKLDPTDPDVLALVDRLDHLPLALELAASRTQIMSPAQISAHLDAGFDVLKTRHHAPRHSAMDACVQWSWELLEPELQRILCQCAVFHAPFTLEEAEAILQTKEWVGEGLQDLVEHSLLVRDAGQPARFRLYGGVRRFLRRQQPIEQEVVRRALKHFAEHPLETSPWNLLGAAEMGFEVTPNESVELLVKARPSLVARGFPEQCSELLSTALTLDLPAALQAQALIAKAYIAGSADQAVVTPLLAAADELPADDETERARRTVQIEMLRSFHADQRAEHDVADRHMQIAMEALEVLGDSSRVECIQLLATRGFAALRRGEADRALALFQEVQQRAQHMQDMWVARGDAWVGMSYLALGQPKVAAPLLTSAVELLSAADAAFSSYAGHALAAALLDEPARALAVAQTAYEAAVTSQRTTQAGAVRSFIARVSGAPDAAKVIREQVRQLRGGDDYLDYAGSWLGLVAVLTNAGDFAAARRELAALRGAIESRATAAELRWLDRYGVVIAALDGSMEGTGGDADFEAAVRSILSGAAVDHEAFDDPCTRFLFEHCPAPLQMLLDLHESAGGRPRIRLLEDGTRVVLPDGSEVSLEKRHLLRRLFLRLCECEGDEVATSDDLLQAGWPDEQMTYDSGLRRLYAAVRNLRKLGLEDVVYTAEEGYRVHPDFEVVRD